MKAVRARVINKSSSVQTFLCSDCIASQFLIDMSPKNRHSTGKTPPSRPKVSWDGKTLPWTDSHGAEVMFAEAVEKWLSYHDLLPDTNSKKYPEKFVEPFSGHNCTSVLVILLDLSI